MSRAVKIINEIPSNKAGMKLFADALVNAVMNGYADPLEVRSRIDAIEKIIKAVKDDLSFKDAVLDQADLWPEKSFEHNGVKFTKAESARYDYSDDIVWNELKTLESEFAGKRKEREGILKALTEPTKIGDVDCNPPGKQSSTHVRVNF